MSQDHVELVQGLAMGIAAEGDVVALHRDEARMERLMTAASPFFHEDLETVVRGWPAGERTYPGSLLGQLRFWEDWLAPWVEYRQEVWKAVDLGDRVLLLFHDFGRHEDGTQEVGGETAGIWTVRDGRVARMEFFLAPAEALKAAGLE